MMVLGLKFEVLEGTGWVFTLNNQESGSFGICKPSILQRIFNCYLYFPIAITSSQKLYSC